MVKNLPRGKCTVEFTKKGPEIRGPCEEDLRKLFEDIFQLSKRSGVEISAYACVDPKTGRVRSVIPGETGTSTSTSLPYGRVCPSDEVQVSIHTHPTSGKAKFSNIDAMTIIDRMNEGKDDVSCVIGEDKTQCLLRVLMLKECARA